MDVMASENFQNIIIPIFKLFTDPLFFNMKKMRVQSFIFKFVSNKKILKSNDKNSIIIYLFIIGYLGTVKECPPGIKNAYITVPLKEALVSDNDFVRWMASYTIIKLDDKEKNFEKLVVNRLENEKNIAIKNNLAAIISNNSAKGCYSKSHKEFLKYYDGVAYGYYRFIEDNYKGDFDLFLWDADNSFNRDLRYFLHIESFLNGLS